MLTEYDLYEVEITAKEQFLAVAFLLGADTVRYGTCVKAMQNAYLKGNNDYPQTVTAAYHFLLHWVPETPTQAP